MSPDPLAKSPMARIKCSVVADEQGESIGENHISERRTNANRLCVEAARKTLFLGKQNRRKELLALFSVQIHQLLPSLLETLLHWGAFPSDQTRSDHICRSFPQRSSLKI